MLPQFQPILPEEKVVEEEEDFKYLYALSIFSSVFIHFLFEIFLRLKSKFIKQWHQTESLIWEESLTTQNQTRSESTEPQVVDWLLSMLVRDKRLSSQWEKPSQESAVSSRLVIKRWEDRPIPRELFLELMAVFLLQSNLKREFSRPSSALRFRTLRLS